MTGRRPEIGKRWVGAGLRVDHIQLDLGPESKEVHEGFQQGWEDFTCQQLQGQEGLSKGREKAARLEARSIELG